MTSVVMDVTAGNDLIVIEYVLGSIRPMGGMEQGSWYTVYYLVSYPLYLYGNNKYRPEQDPCVPIVPALY